MTLARRRALQRRALGRLVMACALAAILPLTMACDDDSPAEDPSPPLETAENEPREGNVDVGSTIVDPAVAASNAANNPAAPNDPTGS